MEEKEKKIIVDDSIVDILDEDEDIVFKEYAERYLDKRPGERLNQIQEELLKTLIYIDKQLKTIDEITEGKGFVRSVYEQKNNLISQRISILKQLSEIQIKQEQMQQEAEDVSSIKEILS